MDAVRSFISGVSFRVGSTAAMDGLFCEPPGEKPDIEFFRARGLKRYCAQVESTAVMCASVVRDALFKSAVAPEQVGAVVIDADQWHCTAEDRIQMLESLYESGMSRVPVIGVGLQTCSGCMTAIDIADRLLRTDTERRPVLILICGRVAPGTSRIDPRRATILSDGVAACIVSVTPGPLALLASTSHTSLDVVRAGVAGEKAAISVIRSCRDISAVSKVLYRASGVRPEQIEALFCTNGNLMYTTYAARAAGINCGRTYNQNVAEYGHVFSCDHLINLATYGTANAFRDGGKYMLIGWSPYVFSGAIVSYVGAPS